MPSPNHVITRIRLRLRGIFRTLESELDEATLSRLEREVEMLKNNYRRLGSTAPDHGNLLRELVEVSNIISHLLEISSEGIQQRTSRRHQRIDKNKLQHLINMGFSIRRIASEGLLGFTVHYNTIHRFIRKNGMYSIRELFTRMPDNELRGIITRLNLRYPNAGVREMLSHLRNHSPPIILQRDRCRQILSEVDPIGTASRWAQGIHRRQYSVPTPNSLWHIDTHHRLIR